MSLPTTTKSPRPSPPGRLHLGKFILEPFDIFFILWQIVMLILFCTKTEYADVAEALADDRGVANEYVTYSGIALMMYVGFGYLMTFLRRNGYTAVGTTFMVSAVTMQWGILVQSFAEHLLEQRNNHTGEHIENVLKLNLRSLILGLFMIAPVLISFGAIIGKVSTYELLFISFFEVIFLGINNYIANGRGTLLETLDMGGSVFIHLFGAYFGLAIAYVLCHSRMKAKRLADHPKAGPSYNSDLFSLIGTLALFIYWPSFNAALAKFNPSPAHSQMRVILNTVFAQSAGAFMTFIFSRVLRRAREGEKRAWFEMADIQNATLAGAVAVGCTSDLPLGPGGAIGAGIAGSLIATFGFVFIQPYLVRRIGLHDTCGVHNLHGLPGLFGGILSIIVTRIHRETIYGTPVSAFYPHGTSQHVYQIYGILITLAFSIASGVVTAYVLLAVRRWLNPIPDEYLFEDAADYVVAGDKVEDVEMALVEGTDSRSTV